ncbi:MAG: PspC domain-containing protein [Bacteroidales bacterium]|nr:PspC domain-containing protein [Bacteroidales bacterium]
MKKVLQINLGGTAFHMDEDAYMLIKRYLDSLQAFFLKEGDSGKEIISDIENRLSELLYAFISDKKHVITYVDAEGAIKTLGKIEDFEFRIDPESFTSTGYTYQQRAYRKLFRDPDDSYLGGVCGGLGAYFGINPVWIRILFVLFIFPFHFGFFFFNGLSVLVYVVLWIIVPRAVTTADKLQMRGEPVTVENIKRSVKDEFSKVKTSAQNSENLRKTGNVVEEIIHVFGKIILIFLKSY